MIETVDRLKRILEAKESELEIAKGTIRMAVDRLGGTVEGKPTHEGNFLQRIDQLRSREIALTEIAAYDSVDWLRANAQKKHGLSFEQALEMAYENMRNEARTELREKYLDDVPS